MLSHYNGRHRNTVDAYLRAGRATALVIVAAFTVAAGSAGVIATSSHPDTVAQDNATSAVPAGFLARNPAPYVSRSLHRAGLPQSMVGVTVPDGVAEDQRVARAKADAARVARSVRTQTIRARARARAARTTAAKARAAKAMDARKAQAVAGQIEVVEAAMVAKRAAGTSPGPTTAATAAAKEWAAREVRRMGWEPVQFTCLDKLWTRESGWNPRADNPTSTAYGIPQSLPGSKMASAGADWRTNPETQMAWGLGYIKARYGDPCHAWAHSESDNWY